MVGNLHTWLFLNRNYNFRSYKKGQVLKNRLIWKKQGKEIRQGKMIMEPGLNLAIADDQAIKLR
jgi:hypothetical protein